MSAAVITPDPIKLVIVRDEPRVDTRLLAAQLGIDHRSAFRLVSDYRADFEQLGLLRFEVATVKKSGERGAKHNKFALLNEDQAYLLLAYTRNTARVRTLKVRLVQAFRLARDGAAIGKDYLPFYQALHDEVKRLADAAHDAGSHTPEQIFHVNHNKLINRVLGLESGDRQNLTPQQRLTVTAANAIARQSIRDTLGNGGDHRTAYEEAKRRLETWAAATVPLLERKAA